MVDRPDVVPGCDLPYSSSASFLLLFLLSPLSTHRPLLFIGDQPSAKISITAVISGTNFQSSSA
jgi:hypothetical protein